MLPKLHKSKESNNIIMAKNSEYINVDKGRPIVVGPCYHTSVVSKMFLWNQLFLLLNIF